MTKDDIIRMAREANLEEAVPGLFYASVDGLERFAAHERDECAKLAESEPRVWEKDAPDPQTRIAKKIRARGNQ